MTILNVAFDRERALIVSDELGVEEHEACVSAGRHLANCQCRVAVRSKVLVLPHLRLACAFFGEELLADGMLHVLNSRCWEPVVMAEMLAEVSAYLQDLGACYDCDEANLGILLRVDDDGRVGGWLLQGREYRVTTLEPGAHLIPPVPGLALSATSWAHLEHAVTAAAHRQNADSRFCSGGRLHLTYMDHSGFRVQWGDQLKRNIGG